MDKPQELTYRIPEPEIMDDWEQAQAYASADFSGPHEMFVDLIEARFGKEIKGLFLDLGCGPCDVAVRFARRFPETVVHGLDASEAMLAEAKKIIAKNAMQDRIGLFKARLPLSGNELPVKSYDGVIVNSLLHHLPSQSLLWNTIENLVKDDGYIFVMDLIRPKDTEKAKRIVERYSGSEPEILRRDFFNSLLAAYRISEVRGFLRRGNLSHLTMEKVSDRHFIVWGRSNKGRG